MREGRQTAPFLCEKHGGNLVVLPLLAGAQILEGDGEIVHHSYPNHYKTKEQFTIVTLLATMKSNGGDGGGDDNDDNGG